MQASIRLYTRPWAGSSEPVGCPLSLKGRASIDRAFVSICEGGSWDWRGGREHIKSMKRVSGTSARHLEVEERLARRVAAASRVLS